MRCKDTWKRFIPPNKLSAYKQMLDEGLIKNPNVTYYKQSRVTDVEYDSDLPHEVILQEMSIQSKERRLK